MLAYTGYRRSIGDVLENSPTSSNTSTAPSSETAGKSNVNESQISNNDRHLELENHNITESNDTMKTTATIYTQNTTSSSQSSAIPTNNNLQNSSENFIKNEINQNQQQQSLMSSDKPPTAPKPAPRTRLSSQNSIPLTNGDSKSSTGDEAQVRNYFI